MGGFLSTVDYCPIFSPVKLYNVVNVDCTNKTIQDYYNNFNLIYPYESFGSDSRCFLSTEQRSLCRKITLTLSILLLLKILFIFFHVLVKTICNKELRKVQIMVGSVNLTCDYAGQVVSVQGYTTKILCPALSKICPE